MVDVAGLRILDMGCSDGFYSFYLAEMGANVLGVDIDERRIRKANFIRQQLKMDNIQFDCGNILDPNFQSKLPQFDVVFAWGFLHRVADPFNALNALAAKADSVVLEWEGPLLPFLMQMSMAIHSGGGRLEWQGADNVSIEDIDENSAGRQSDRVGFWNMTPGAVRTMIGRFGLREAYCSYESASLAYCFHILRTMSRNRISPKKYQSWLKLIRIHGLYERGQRSILKPNTVYGEPLPAASWDASLSRS